jgi:hypothetical protein
MKKYIDNLNDELKEYFNILCDNDYPVFIDKYIELPEMQRLSKIGQFCGCDYTKIFNIKFWYSRLDHSIACALMAWHFTKDKNQTLLALFHDLGTPAFSHAVDYLFGDHIHQKSSEKSVYGVLNSSETIKKFLIEDNFDINEMNNLKKYTIVENSKPKICVDRLDGVMHTCLIWIGFWNIEDIKYVYKNIGVLQNEDNEKEIGLLNKEACENFFEGAYEYSIVLQQNEDKYAMQFIADYIKDAVKKEYINVEDLYIKSEQEIINQVYKMNPIKWDKFKNSEFVIRTDVKPENVYYISLDTKKRYVVPLCYDYESNSSIRLDQMSQKCRDLIDYYLSYNDTKYAYIEDIF